MVVSGRKYDPGKKQPKRKTNTPESTPKKKPKSATATTEGEPSTQQSQPEHNVDQFSTDKDLPDPFDDTRDIDDDQLTQVGDDSKMLKTKNVTKIKRKQRKSQE